MINKFSKLPIILLSLAGMALSFTEKANAADSFTIGGSVTGLNGQGLALQNNGKDTTFVYYGKTTFQCRTPVVAGGDYNITVFTQPQGLWCSVTKGSGSNVQANITDVSVDCLPNNQFAYVPNYDNNTVSLCYLNATTGLFNPYLPCKSVLSGLSSPSDVVIHPTKPLAYITNASYMGNVSVCSIQAGTALLNNCQVAAAFNNPKAIVFNASGTKAYVASFQRAFVCSLNVANGYLEACNLTGPTLDQMSAIALHQAAGVAYLTDGYNNTVHTCPINSDGTISNTCSQTTGFSSPQGLTLNPSGSMLYVSNNNTKRLSACRIASDGALSACHTLVTSPTSIFSGYGHIVFNKPGTKVYTPYANYNLKAHWVYVCDVDKVTGEFANCQNSSGTGFSGPAGLALY